MVPDNWKLAVTSRIGSGLSYDYSPYGTQMFFT